MNIYLFYKKINCSKPSIYFKETLIHFLFLINYRKGNPYKTFTFFAIFVIQREKIKRNEKTINSKDIQEQINKSISKQQILQEKIESNIFVNIVFKKIINKDMVLKNYNIYQP